MGGGGGGRGVRQSTRGRTQQRGRTSQRVSHVRCAHARTEETPPHQFCVRRSFHADRAHKPCTLHWLRYACLPGIKAVTVRARTHLQRFNVQRFRSNRASRCSNPNPRTSGTHPSTHSTPHSVASLVTNARTSTPAHHPSAQNAARSIRSSRSPRLTTRLASLLRRAHTPRPTCWPRTLANASCLSHSSYK